MKGGPGFRPCSGKKETTATCGCCGAKNAGGTWLARPPTHFRGPKRTPPRCWTRKKRRDDLAVVVYSPSDGYAGVVEADLARRSNEQNAHSPVRGDYPLFQRFDENDAVADF